MATDVLLLNFVVVDYRRDDFSFVSERVKQGGIYRGTTDEMPLYTQEQYARWVEQGCATVGGVGNSAPLLARAGLNVAVGANLGRGKFGGLDAPGRFIYDEMSRYGIDMSQTYIHPRLPSAVAFIHDLPQEDRKGIATFPNANNDFDFERFKESVDKLKPKIVYYMYSGLSDRGDANEGRDLAAFIKWCIQKGIITIVDSHTLTVHPEYLIRSGGTVKEYHLLVPLLPEVDLFFVSSDEAQLIGNTLFDTGNSAGFRREDPEFFTFFLDRVAAEFWLEKGRTRFFGVTVPDGAYEKHRLPVGKASVPRKITSRFLADGDVNLIGAGDAFRSGVIAYIAYHSDDFKRGSMDFNEAVQMGNLFASMYVKNPRSDRFREFTAFGDMLERLRRS